MILERWAERQFKIVEQDGTATARVRLICVNDQSCLEIWESPFEDPARWAAEAMGLIDAWLNDMPTKPISLLFVAEDKQGAQRSSCPMNVRGKNREASSDLLKGRDVKALADSMESQARTMDKILGTANAQLDRMNTTLETVTKANADLLDYVREKHTNEALTAKENAATTGTILELINQYADPLMNMIGASIRKAQATAPAAAAAATNGAATAASVAAEVIPPHRSS